MKSEKSISIGRGCIFSLDNLVSIYISVPIIKKIVGEWIYDIHYSYCSKGVEIWIESLQGLRLIFYILLENNDWCNLCFPTGSFWHFFCGGVDLSLSVQWQTKCKAINTTQGIVFRLSPLYLVGLLLKYWEIFSWKNNRILCEAIPCEYYGTLEIPKRTSSSQVWQAPYVM